MKEKIFIFDLNDNKTFDDVEKIIQNYNFTLPSIKQLQRWGDIDYKLSDNEFKVFKAFSKHKITLYHGCKTFDINKYYKNGIMVLNKKNYLIYFQNTSII